MGLTTQLGKPDATSIIKGKFSLFEYFSELASVAAPVAAVQIEDIQDFGMNAMSQTDEKIFHYGGGKDYRLAEEYDGEYTGTLQMLAGGMGRIIAALLGKTYTLAGEASLPLGHLPRYPLCHIQAFLRRVDNLTHIKSVVLQDLIFDPIAYPVAMGLNTIDLPFRSNYDPFELVAGAEMVFDKFSGDGSTTDFTLSSTPLDMVTATESHLVDWDFNTAAFVKVKLSGEDTGTRQKGTCTITGTTLAFSTAPAASSEISCFYAKATP